MLIPFKPARPAPLRAESSTNVSNVRGNDVSFATKSIVDVKALKESTDDHHFHDASCLLSLIY